MFLYYSQEIQAFTVEKAVGDKNEIIEGKIKCGCVNPSQVSSVSYIAAAASETYNDAYIYSIHR